MGEAFPTPRCPMLGWSAVGPFCECHTFTTDGEIVDSREFIGGLAAAWHLLTIGDYRDAR